jgi:hypothetical protein
MQNYKNHARYYLPHHFVFYPLLGVLIAFAIRQALVDEVNATVWVFMSVVTLLIGWLSFMLRQHYAMTLQNRVVVLELRYRYFAITGNRLEPLETELTFGQIAALRFAPDEELPGLLQRAIAEKLPPSQIKKSIQNWLPDNRRV